MKRSSIRLLSVLSSTLISLVVALVSIWYVFTGSSDATYVHKPSRINTMWGMTVGVQENDVWFEKGEPDGKIDLENGAGEFWLYYVGDVTYTLNIKDGLLTYISKEKFDAVKQYQRDASKTDYSMSNEYNGTDKGLLGINFGDVPNTVTGYLGSPDTLRELNGGKQREYDYRESLNVSYLFEKGQVILMSIGER